MGRSKAAEKRRNLRREAQRREDAQYGPWQPVPDSERYITIAREPMNLVYEQTKWRTNKVTGNISVKSQQVEGSIHPVPMKFAPPLQEFGSNPKAFRHHWERLTYLFDLRDPSLFPPLDFSDEDRGVIERFIYTCRRLAGYTAINDGGRITYKSVKGEWRLYADFPAHDVFVGLSGTFRQLHKAGEPASFNKVKKIIETATAPLESPAAARAIIKQWTKAHVALNDKMVSTMICERLQDGAPTDVPKSLQGVNPEHVIDAHNYGDNLHWGDKREQLAELQNDELSESFHKQCCLGSMIQLSHFYFGFAVLAASAIADAPVI